MCRAIVNLTSITMIGLKSDTTLANLVQRLAGDSACTREDSDGNTIYRGFQPELWGVSGEMTFILLGKGKPGGRVQALRHSVAFAPTRFALLTSSNHDDAWARKCRKSVEAIEDYRLAGCGESNSADSGYHQLASELMSVLSRALESKRYPRMPKYHVASL